ncbi:MAG TPA: response regulator [Candidatus Desulfofervidus auxilii]|uniref:Response regulator n=1 Tax=Desulfofervidus auxilii TaxID=1621989 RepID=A0A7V0IAG4_DESA2|nr:response regulator [Candidatus Desulfofervidus auxilii]
MNKGGKEIPVIVFIIPKQKGMSSLKKRLLRLIKYKGREREYIIKWIKKFLGIPEGSILVAEDDPASQRLIRNILENEGLNVDIVENGEAALMAVKERVYDIIVMDMRMPKLDGYEATKRLKEDPKTKHIPVIALTAHALKEDKERCLKAGADDYLAKPVTKSKLLRILKKHMETHLAAEEEEDRIYYINYLKETVHAMDVALRTGDFNTFLRLAHNLKGSGQSYGFTEISFLGKMLEEEFKEGKKEIVKFLFKKLCQKVKEYETNQDYGHRR